MKKHLKHVLLLFIICIMSVITVYADTADVTDFSLSQYGYASPSWRADPLVENSTKLYAASVLPERYDSVSSGIIKEPGNQQTEDICWAMASTSVAETAARLFLGKKDADYSENHLKFISSRYADDGTWQYGFDREPEGGGNFLVSTACYMRGNGPVNEEDEPFLIGAPRKTLAQLQSYNSAAQITGAVFMPSNASIEDIKRAIMNYGSVTVAIYWERDYANSSSENYYYNGGLTANHQVTLVGWDDTYSKSKFKNTPSSDGAFLVKNSWGTSNHINGYFWLSYNDSHVNDTACYINGISEKIYDNVHQYDPFGFTGATLTLGAKALFYNRFDIEKTEKLCAVGFYSANHNADYNIYLNTKDGTAGGIDTSRPAASGHIDYSGYYIVPVEEQYLSGNEFIAMVELTPLSGEKAKVPLETNAYTADGNTFISQTVQNANEGYYYNGGWKDASAVKINYSNGVSSTGVSICLKAYTDNASADGDKSYRITYKNKNGESLKQPVSGDITVTADVSGGENMRLIAAAYDENGLLRDVNASDISNNTASAKINCIVGGTVKAFIFNKNNFPEPVFANAGILNSEYKNPCFLNDTVILREGDTYYINVESSGGNAAHVYEYTSADNMVAAVSEGKITAVKRGETEITSNFGKKLRVIVIA